MNKMKTTLSSLVRLEKLVGLGKLGKLASLVLLVSLVTTGCTKQPTATLDYNVFEDEYYYMTTAERDSVWAMVPADTLAANPRLNHWHEAFLKEQTTAVGAQYLDFTMPMPMMGDLSISNLVGKTDYLLLDFWASWCPPCRALMPTLKEKYAEMDGRLEIIGISLDDNKEEWINMIERLDLPWAHMSDLQGRDNAASVAYGVFCIPTLVLIDANGTIIARGCDEEAVLSCIR